MKKAIRIPLLCLLVLAFIVGVWYSGHIQSITGMGDFRSRVVGARQIIDGHSPYYYSWYPGDSLRYFSGSVVDTPRVKEKELANLTASPVMLRAFTLFANADEYKIDWGLFITFHLFFLISIGLALYYSPPKKRWLTLLLLVPLVLTDGWIYHFYVVQHYMLYGFMLMLIALLLIRNKQIAAGIVFALLFLFRLNTLLFALPFLLLGWRYRKFFITSFMGVALYAAFALVNRFEKSLWMDYFSSLKIHQAHQMIENVPATQGNLYTLPLLPRPFEGTDYMRLDSLMQREHFHINKESSNFKNAYEAATGHYPPAIVLQALLLAGVVMVLAWYFYRLRRSGPAALPPYQLAMAGLLLYFLSNFFSTVSTVPYHLPQWWAVGVLFAIFCDRIPKVALVLFLLGILLNNHLAPDFRGRHLLAEMILLASAAITVFLPERKRGTQEQDNVPIAL